jgi:hypothetical protein
MEKNILCISMMVMMVFSSFAQECTPATLLQKPGDWKEGLKGSTSGVSAADLTRQKNVVELLHAMIKSKYVPMGVSADFNGAYDAPRSVMPGNGYSYNIIPLNYYCEGGTIKTNVETSTLFSIKVNFFDAEIYNAAQGDRALAEGYNVMTDMPIEKDGYLYFKDKHVSTGPGGSGKTGTWLITYNGKLPYSYVSRKEFLEKRRQNLTTQMQSTSSGFKDVLKNLEIEKGFKEKEYKNDAAKLQKYMEMDYLPSKERYEKLLAENEKTFKPAFSKIESSVRLPIAELSLPAIVKNDPNDPLSYLFTDDNDPFGKILIKPNPAYFNKTLPRSSPQFFSVCIDGNSNDPIAARAMADMVKAVDFAKLRSMLGK